MIVGAGAVIGGAMFAAAPLLIQLMGAEDTFAALAVQYMQVYALCSPVTTIIFAVDNYLRICGFIRGSMWMNILMSILSGRVGIFVPRCVPVGDLGGGFGHLFRHVGLRPLHLIPFFRGKALLRFCRPRFRFGMIRQIVACGSPNF